MRTGKASVEDPTGTPIYSLRPAAPEDLAFIHALRVSGLREYVDQVWGWDDAEQLARFQHRFVATRYKVIVVGGRDIGAVAVDWAEHEVFLADIEILPEWRGRGLGTAAISDLIAAAARCRLPVALQVLRVNPARRLYERLGFQIVGETATHYRMCTMPAEPSPSSS